MHRAAAEKEEAGKKKAAPTKKGKQARVWGDAPSGRGEALPCCSQHAAAAATPSCVLAHAAAAGVHMCRPAVLPGCAPVQQPGHNFMATLLCWKPRSMFYGITTSLCLACTAEDAALGLSLSL